MMDLNKCEVIGKYTWEFYCRKDEIIDNKKYVLLGFHESLPVLSNMMFDKKKVVTKNNTLKVEGTGEKFITLNGRKLKRLSESELPDHVRQRAQNIKALPHIEKKPIKIKILGGIPSLLRCPPRLLKFPESQGVDKNIIKTNVNNKIDSKINIVTTSLDLSKAKLIRDNKLLAVKNPSNIKVVEAITSTQPISVKSENVKLINSYYTNQCTKLNSCPVKVQNNKNMKALDLTVLNKYKNELSADVKTTDKSLQTDDIEFGYKEVQHKDFLDKEVQTEPFTPPPASPFDYLSSIDFDDLLSINDSATGQNSLTSIKNMEMCCTDPLYLKKVSFLTDLRTALHPDDKGNMPIHVGVLKNDLQMLKRCCNVLKALKRDVNLLNSTDLTPLQLAIMYDSSTAIVMLLLEKGATLDCTDSEGNTLLHLAVEYQRTDALEILLIHAEEYVNKFNAEGLTPLMLCCLHSLHQCAELLIDYKADVNVRDQKSGRTALFHAAERHDSEMVQLLLNNHADTKLKNYFGTSPHDAMYEIEEMPDPIKSLILGRTAKRKMTDEPKSVKTRKKEDKKLKTYARFQKISPIDMGYNNYSIAK